MLTLVKQGRSGTGETAFQTVSNPVVIEDMDTILSDMNKAAYNLSPRQREHEEFLNLRRAIFADLPPMKNPKGIDDTDKVCEIIAQAYPDLPYFPDQTHNRRKLYMAIQYLRKNLPNSWVIDAKVGRLKKPN